MTAAAAWPAGMVIERDVAIPMTDGVALAADVFRPSAGPPVPVIMSMGPYGKGIHFRDWQRAEWDRLITRHPEVLDGSSGQHMAWELADPERWVPHGYAVVRVDSRGAGRSPGYLDCLSPQETGDFCQAIEWAAAQPWSTGKVGLCGVSYYAMTQWLAAARQPPHLAAILVWEGAQDFYRDVTHHGGILSSLFPRLWYQRRVVANQHGQGARGLADRGAGRLAAGPETLSEEALHARRADRPAAAREHPSTTPSTGPAPRTCPGSPSRCCRPPTGPGSACTPAATSPGSPAPPPHTSGCRCTADVTSGSTCRKAPPCSGGSSTASSRGWITAGGRSRVSSCTSAAPGRALSSAPSTNGRSPEPAGPACTSTRPGAACDGSPPARTARSPSPRWARA